MRAKILAKRQKYDQKSLQALEEKKKREEQLKLTEAKKSADSDDDDDNDDEEDDDKSKTRAQVSEAYRRKESRLSFKRTGTTEGEEEVTRRRNHGSMSESSILAQLDKFKKALKEKPKNEDEEWKSHSLVFEKEVNRIDPMRRKEEKYEVYDPLKGEKEKIANYHQRRLAKTKNLEKW